MVNKTEDVSVRIKSKLNNIDAVLITPDRVTDLITEIGHALIDTAKNTFEVSNRVSRNRNNENKSWFDKFCKEKLDEFTPYVVSLKQHFLCHIKLN